MTDAVPSLNDVAQMLARTPKFVDLKAYFERVKAAAPELLYEPEQWLIIAWSEKHICGVVAIRLTWPHVGHIFHFGLVALMLVSTGSAADVERACKHLHGTVTYVRRLTAQPESWISTNCRTPSTQLFFLTIQACIGPEGHILTDNEWKGACVKVLDYCARTHTLLVKMMMGQFRNAGKVNGVWQSTGRTDYVLALLPLHRCNNGVNAAGVTVLPVPTNANSIEPACFGPANTVFIRTAHGVIEHVTKHNTTQFVRCDAMAIAMVFSEELNVLAVLALSEIDLDSHVAIFYQQNRETGHVTELASIPIAGMPTEHIHVFSVKAVYEPTLQLFAFIPPYGPRVVVDYAHAYATRIIPAERTFGVLQRYAFHPQNITHIFTGKELAPTPWKLPGRTSTVIAGTHKNSVTVITDVRGNLVLATYAAPLGVGKYTQYNVASFGDVTAQVPPAVHSRLKAEAQSASAAAQARRLAQTAVAETEESAVAETEESASKRPRLKE